MVAIVISRRRRRLFPVVTVLPEASLTGLS